MMEAIPGREIESQVTLLSQGTFIKGEVTLDSMSRVNGRIEGKVFGLIGSVIVISETATVHGEISGDEIFIDGFVHGNVKATTKVTLSECGRLIGNIDAPKVEIRFGAHFEGRAITATTTTAASSLDH